MYLAQNLKFLREQMGIGQDEMAKKMDVTQSAVGNWEKNYRKPDIEMIVRLAEYFGVSLDDLVLKDMRPPKPMYAENMAFLRKQYDMKQKDIANLLKVEVLAVSKYEKGKIPITIDKLIILADYFGLTLDQLVKQDLSKEVNARDHERKSRAD